MTTSPNETTNTQALHAFLNPGFQEFLPETFDDWMPEIRDEDLRGAMLSNPRFEDRLTAHAYQKHKIKGEMPADECTVQVMLLAALQAHPQDLVERVGCMWHADALADAATQGQLFDMLPDIEVGTIRWALNTATERPKRQLSNTELAKAVLTDGYRCIAGWLATLHPQLRARIALTSVLVQRISEEAVTPFEPSSIEHDSSIKTVRICLAALTETA